MIRLVLAAAIIVTLVVMSPENRRDPAGDAAALASRARAVAAEAVAAQAAERGLDAARRQIGASPSGRGRPIGGPT